ncbi:hypothetical protein J6590_008360 [Homalodisca vitripennis]|nr:hypothetical protein J6590_008360 [Homalodisca vitripennis]
MRWTIDSPHYHTMATAKVTAVFPREVVSVVIPRFAAKCYTASRSPASASPEIWCNIGIAISDLTFARTDMSLPPPPVASLETAKYILY